MRTPLSLIIPSYTNTELTTWFRVTKQLARHCSCKATAKIIHECDMRALGHTLLNGFTLYLCDTVSVTACVCELMYTSHVNLLLLLLTF
jgi:hypothetical protein